MITNVQLHASIVDRAIKKLTTNNLIKTVKDVTRPTRKVYMLYDLEPSTEMTGGPWYNESEFDVAFIEAHAQAILKFIREAVSVTNPFTTIRTIDTTTVIVYHTLDLSQTSAECYGDALPNIIY